MGNTLFFPDDPLQRFRDIYEALNKERGWASSASPLRFAAMTAVTCPGRPFEVATAIRDKADEIKAASGWFGTLNSQLRFIIGAMLMLRNDTVDDFLDEVKRVRQLLREASLRRANVYETMAILILRFQAGREPIRTAAVERFRAIYEEMKRYHWWLTGPDDFPACAILTGQDETPSRIGHEIERIYNALREEGFSTGDPLQTAANILYLARLEPGTIAHRYRKLASSFRAKSVSIWQSDYDELAILSFLDHPTHVVVERVLDNRAVMEALRPKPDRSLTFNLAASVAFLELVRLDQDMKVITDVKALLDMQAIINAQQAAAAASASSAASASAASR